MPFRSEKQRRYLWAKEPEVAKRWTKKYGSKIQKGSKRTYKHGSGILEGNKCLKKVGAL